MADIVSPAPWRALDANGNPVAGAQARFFRQGTTTPLTVYSDEAGSTAHPVPLLADAGGIFPAVFDTSSFNVKVDVKHPVTGASLPGYPVDFARMSSTSTGAAGTITFAPTADIPETNVQDAVARVQANWTGAKTGVAAGLVSGTAGTPSDLAMWNAAGDLVDGPSVPAETNMNLLTLQVARRDVVKTYVDTQVTAAQRVLARCAFNGTGTSPLSVEANGLNVTNVTKNGTGDYTINFTTNLPNTNYAVQGMCVRSATDSNLVVNYQSASARAVGSVRIVVQDRGGTLQDSALITVTVIG